MCQETWSKITDFDIDIERAYVRAQTRKSCSINGKVFEKSFDDLLGGRKYKVIFFHSALEINR